MGAITRSRRDGLVPRIGRRLLVLGSLLLAFTAYQLWGTAIYEHQAQDHLRSQLEARLDGGTKHPTAVDSSNTNSSGGDSPALSGPAPSPAEEAAAASAPALNSALGFLTIPRIGMTDAAVIEGVGESQLQQGPGHYPGTALPGQEGNVGIAGHRTTYGAPFYELDQLQPGDPIYLQVQQGVFEYTVTKAMVVSPSDTGVLAPQALPMLTLTTCNPRYSSSTRLVVVALLEGAHNLPGATMSSASPTTTTQPAPTRLAAGATPSLAAAGADDAPTGGGVVAAAWWGAVLALAWLVVRFLGRRPRPRPVRLGAFVLGAPCVALVLFAFFEHVSVTLPASF